MRFLCPSHMRDGRLVHVIAKVQMSPFCQLEQSFHEVIPPKRLPSSGCSEPSETNTSLAWVVRNVSLRMLLLNAYVHTRRYELVMMTMMMAIMARSSMSAMLVCTRNMYICGGHDGIVTIVVMMTTMLMMTVVMVMAECYMLLTGVAYPAAARQAHTSSDVGLPISRASFCIHMSCAGTPLDCDPFRIVRNTTIHRNPARCVMAAMRSINAIWIRNLVRVCWRVIAPIPDRAFLVLPSHAAAAFANNV